MIEVKLNNKNKKEFGNINGSEIKVGGHINSQLGSKRSKSGPIDACLET